MSANEKELIRVEDLHKSFGSLQVLKGVTEHVNHGEVVSVIGPSGGGKSTFLRCLNLLETPTSGKIYFEGTDITDKNVDINLHRQKMGMVFQHFNLFPNMTIRENICLAPVKLKLMTKEEASKKADELLERVGLKDKADTYPAMLSGGQKQRAAVARALITQPQLILADEPTGALDSRSTDQLLDLFQSINEDGQTIVMVTHSTKAASRAKRVLFIKDGEVFHQIYKANMSDEEMYAKISAALTVLATGGEQGE